MNKTTIRSVAVFAAGIGAAGWLTAKFLLTSQLAPFEHLFVIAVAGGVVLWIIGTLL